MIETFRKIYPEKLIELNQNASLRDPAKVFGVHPRSIRKVLHKLKITRKKRQISTKKEMKRNEKYFWSV